MKADDLFIDSKLLRPLKTEEIHDYFEKMKKGDMTAREKIINHNIRLVINEVIKKFSNSPYDLKELVSIGLIGLIKSVDTFDTTKGVQFSTYSTRCIDNEILMFLRMGKNSALDKSLDTPISIDKDGSETRLEDILEDATADFVSAYENEITYNGVRKIVYNLSERDREIILLYFGFIDEHLYTQREIADKLKISRPHVSRLIAKILKKIGIQLQRSGLIEAVGGVGKQTQESNQNEVIRRQSDMAIEGEGIKKMDGKKLQTIYEYLGEYTRKEIDSMLGKLTEDEMSLVKLRYGDDLDKPVFSSALEGGARDKFYGSLVPKMKRLLANPDGRRKNALGRTKTKEITQLEPISQEMGGSKLVSHQATLEAEKDDCLKVLELMRTPSFGEMLKSLTPKEAVIICLKLGYVDEKYFTTESIADFLGIETSEVIETTKKVLLVYRENINRFIDEAVEVATGPSLVLKRGKD